jgi:hypothetical protein
MEETISKMIDDIAKAKEEALKQGIIANTVVINEKYAYVQPFSCVVGQVCTCVPPMLMGMHLLSRKMPEDKIEFLLMESPHNQPSYQELLAENERLKEVEKKYNALKELFKEGL